MAGKNTQSDEIQPKFRSAAGISIDVAQRLLQPVVTIGSHHVELVDILGR